MRRSWVSQELVELADRVTPHVALVEVVTARVKFDGEPSDIAPPYTAITRVNVKAHRSERDVIEVWARYITEAGVQDENADEDDSDLTETAWRLRVDCVALFECPEDLDFTDEELFAFAATEGTPVIHPYARELTQTLTGKSAFPAFTLGLLQAIGTLEGPPAVEPPDVDS